MKTNTETIIDEYGIELLVTYRYEKVTQIEECHGYHDLSYNDITLKNVEIVIAGQSIDLLPMMSTRQETEIKNLLNH